MFLQRFTSEASPVSTAADSFFFHTCKPQAESGRSHTSPLVESSWFPHSPSLALQLQDSIFAKDQKHELNVPFSFAAEEPARGALPHSGRELQLQP